MNLICFSMFFCQFFWMIIFSWNRRRTNRKIVFEFEEPNQTSKKIQDFHRIYNFLSCYSLDDSHDCLTEAFITIYNNSIWCLQSIYEVLFRSFWQVFLLAKGEICYDSIDKMGTIPVNVIPMNNSAGENYPYHRLPRSNSQHSQ